jgi:electron transfer flavoprotein alpha subunit
MSTTPLRIAVLIKQVPQGEQIEIGSDGRLRRDGITLEMNAFCRRAVSKGVELARSSGGRATVFTLGPEASNDVLREAVAWGADEGIHICDQAFAGSDTLATARALSTALTLLGPWDLVLVGRNSIDADTGQVGPAVAQLLDLPFAGAARQLEVIDGGLSLVCQADDTSQTIRMELPGVVAVAERLCDPAKVSEEGRRQVPADKVRRLTAADLGAGPWGAAGSPTKVTSLREVASARTRLRLRGTPSEQVAEAVERLNAMGALTRAGLPVTPAQPARLGGRSGRSGRSGHIIAVLDEGTRPEEMRQLLTAAGVLAAEVSGSVAAVVPGPPDPVYVQTLSTWGADSVVTLEGVRVAEDMARGFVEWAGKTQPWAVLAPSTGWGREVAARAAAALAAGLTGDAIEIEVANGRLIAWKPSFASRFDAAITTSTHCQMVTMRPGAVRAAATRAPVEIAVTREHVAARGRLEVLTEHREDDLEALASADRVIGVGLGVQPEEYEALQPLLRVLGAELAATRKVTDRGWLPLSRQIGITGRMIAPMLYVAIGIGGSLNHTAGVRRAGAVLAINANPEALIFDSCDVGIVADWHEVLPLLTVELSGQRPTAYPRLEPTPG